MPNPDAAVVIQGRFANISAMYLSLTIITTCKGRLGHLQETLPLMVEQGYPVVVVDYDCPENAAAWVQDHYPQVRVISHRPAANFNHSHARNLGAREAASEFLFFVDADVKLAKDLIEQFKPKISSGNYYCFPKTTRELSGTLLCARLDFESVGGYDEVIHGWGGEDTDLYDRFDAKGLTKQLLPEDSMTPLPHSDQMRSAFQAEKRISRSRYINRIYSRTKLDLMLIWGRELDRKIRLQLYKEIELLFSQAEKQPGPVEMHIPIRQSIHPGYEVTFELTIRNQLKPQSDKPKDA